MRFSIRFFAVRALLVLSTLLTLLSPRPSVSAHTAKQPTSSPDRLISSVRAGLQLSWSASTTQISASSLAAEMTPVRFQGYELPMQLMTVQLDDPAALDAIQLQHVASAVVAASAIQPAAPLKPAVLDPEGEYDLTTQVEIVALPSSPLFVVRAGMLDGQLTAVLALSPIYEQNGEVHIASRVDALLPGMRTESLTDSAIQQTRTQPDAQLSTAIPNVPPSNPAASKPGARLKVTQPGMQRILFSTLSAAGLNPATVGVTHNGASVAVESTGSELRFYAGPTIGDRWNTVEYYWLSEGNRLGMESRSVAPAGASTRTTAIEKGIWRDTKLYLSEKAGPDGDHWFHTIMDTDANSPLTDTITPPVAGKLALAAGEAKFTFNLSPMTRTTDKEKCTLRVVVNGQTYSVDLNAMVDSDVGMVLADNWSGSVTGNLQSASISIQLVSQVLDPQIQGLPCAVRFDTVNWEQTVALNFAGKDAAFSGIAETWTYNLAGLPGQSALYDVTNPDVPVILTGFNNGGFQDGPTAKNYFLADVSNLLTPEVIKDIPFDFTTIAGAQAIYVVPASFDQFKNVAALLDPLKKLREGQGYSVRLIDVQDIYDAWSYGKISPQAIRNFFQYAFSNWNPKPLSAVLVGDGTIDPYNYEGKNNINFVPPYTDDKIDPWIKETACDNCYGQLNGLDAVSGDDVAGTSGRFFDIDVWIGRFPVKSEQELQDVVTKLVAYETATDANALWRGTSVFFSDNYVKGVINDSSGTPKVINDPAGNFAHDAEDIIFGNKIVGNEHKELAGMPSTGLVKRIFYDPHPELEEPRYNFGGRYTTPAQAKSALISAIAGGAGLVTYNGHANHWNMAELEVVENNQIKFATYMLSLYDELQYSNKDRYFIQLSMTCLSAQFAKTAVSGTSLDERVFLKPEGGAIALWGPTGLSVSHGHDKLQTGFHRALWSTPPLSASLGQLLEAGYQELIKTGSCCQDALQTFVFFGDPLTKARIQALNGIWLPIINR